MKIQSSVVTMKAEHSSYTHLEQRSESLVTTADKAATLEFSDESKSLVEQMKDYKDNEEQKKKAQAQERKEKNAKEFAMAMAESQKAKQPQAIPVDRVEDLELETLKRILEMLKRMREGKGKLNLKDTIKLAENTKQKIQELRAGVSSSQSLSFGGSISISGGFGLNGGSVISVGGNGSGGGFSAPQTMKKVTVQSSFYTEMEHTAYQSQGLVRCEDGRELAFNVEVEMSRAFCEKYEECLVEDYVCVDPLVFNLKGNVGQISDQKFLFDLNADGTEEEISFTEQGSGFLALDKNKDGQINDGSELFGTQSGDGFKDLAQYDEDGNGWIDENDEIFKDLSIWTLDENGEKTQISLLKADVGAIYLGKASTEFSLKNEETHATNGVIRSTGIFLKESGGVGTVQHIDLAI